jgi:hypothetical protein
MKRTMIILAVATASMVAFAKPDVPASTPAPAPAAVPAPAPVVNKKESAQAVTPITTSVYIPPLTLKNSKVEHTGGVSSRPWAQVVGWHPGYSAFPSPEQHDPSMPIISIGNPTH